MRRLLIRSLNFLLIALLATAIWAGWYVSHRGFGQKWRKKVAEEFARRGIWLSMRRLTLDPLRGLVAQDVKIYRDHRLQGVAARMTQVNLDISYTRLLQKVSFVNALELRGAEVRLPVDPNRPNGRSIRIDNLQARLFFPPERLEIRRFEGDMGGIHLDLSGTLLHPEELRRRRGKSEASSSLDRLYAELARITVPGRKARLTARFSGDLARPDTLQVDSLQLTGEKIRWRKVEAGQVRLTGSFIGGRAVMEDLSWDHAGGRTRITGWRDRSGDFQLQLQTPSLWLDLAREFFPGQPWPDAHFTGPVDLHLEASRIATRQPAMQVLGRLSAGAWNLRDVKFDSLQGSFSTDGTRWMLHRCTAERGSSTVRLDWMAGPDGFSGRVGSTMDLLTILPALPVSVPPILQELHFQSPPLTDFTVLGHPADPSTWTASGRITAGPATFRGYPLNSAQADFSIRRNRAAFTNVQIVRDEGVATGNLTWAGQEGGFQVENVRSTLDPAALAMWISPDFGSAIPSFRFRKSPEIRVEGIFHPQSKQGPGLKVAVNAPAGFHLRALGRDLPFETASGDLFFRGSEMELRNFSGKLFAGTVRAGLTMTFPVTAAEFRLDLDFTGISLPPLSLLYFAEAGKRGSLAGNLSLQASPAQPLSGKGNLTAQEADILSIPIFSPLLKLLNQITPGTDRNPNRQASASFTVQNGRFTIRDMSIAGNGINLGGSGELVLATQEVDFSLHIRPAGLSGVLLDPLTQLIEFQASGPIAKPTWKIRTRPGDSP